MRWRLRGLAKEMKAMRHPEWVRYGNLGLAFMLELGALISFAAAGLLLDGWMQPVGMVVGAAAFVLLWGFLAAPRSRRRLRGMALLAFKVAVYAVAALVLVLIGQPVWGMALAVLAAINLTLGRLLRQH